MSGTEPRPAARWVRILEWAGRRLGTWRAGLSLDLKLAVRMLFKNPGLTAVAVFALALGIPTSLWPFHMLSLIATPLPFQEGERIMALRHSETMLEDGAGTLHAYGVWRETLSSFEELGAALRADFNVVPDDGPVRPWRGAFMSASTFRMARVPPLLGRPLLDQDEVIGAPDVVVLGYQPWQMLFAGDPAAVGRTIRIAGRPHTVVGVMPEGFRFPSTQHLWVPLRGSASAQAGAGPEVWIYGRLAEGVSKSEALAEVTSVEAGLDEAFPDAYGSVRPEVIPYSYLTFGGPGPAGTRLIFGPFQLLALLLLGVACGNVGTLVMARNAARSGEVAVRTALGASRTRIVSQLFVESLVLALLATGLGLLIGQAVMNRFQRLEVWDEVLPFWLDFGLNRRTALTALGIAVFCAVVSGVLPALKATGGNLQRQMQRASAVGGAVGFGRAAAALVVTEVALGVLCLFGGWMGWQLIPRVEPTRTDIALESFLAARLTVPAPERTSSDAPGDDAEPGGFVDFQQELVRRLERQPGVLGVAFADRLPGQYHSMARVEVEGEPLAEFGDGHQVMRADVVPGFFESIGVPMRAGRDFAVSDLPGPESPPGGVVIVNAALAERLFGGTNPTGRRVRYVLYGYEGSEVDREPSPWYEVVGVVGSLGMVHSDPMPDDAGLYHPVPAEDLTPPRVAIHLTGDPASFAPRLRQIAAEIDPAVLVEDPMPLTELLSLDRAAIGWTLFAVAVVAGTAVVLSVASLNALMAFTVAQRTREIGLRGALGAQPGAIVAVIARRAFLQLTSGVLIAVIVCAVVVSKVMPGWYRTMDGWPLALVGAAEVVILVGMLACVAPTLRGLRIRPMDALRV